MKNTFYILVLLISTSLFSQDFTTNSEGSEYKFKKIAHHDATPVLSQGYTGTCWSFSALSFFESELIRKGNENPPILSKMFIARKAYEGKAEKYVRMDGKINFAQGGAFHDIPWVIKRFGLLPQDVYNGLNYGENKHNHQELYAVLNGYMEGLMKHINGKGNNPLTESWKAGFNGILDAYFGKVPEKFKYEGKNYDAKSFAKSLKLNMDDYVSLSSFTHVDNYERFQLAIPDNWAWGDSYNVPLDELLEVTKSALKNGYTIAWGADVSEKGFNFREGLAIIPEDEATIQVKGRDNQNFSDAGAEKNSNAFVTPVKELNISPEIRQKAYDNKTTTDDHGMHITGLYEDQNGKNYFLVKNSWGTNNYPEGYLFVSENYFLYKTINVYLHKDGIEKSIANKIKF